MEIVKKLENLYTFCTPIDNIQCNTVDYNIFKEYSNTRFCDSKVLIKHIPVGDDKRLDAFHGFIHDNPYFWMLPLATSEGEIFGFVLKSYHQKAYRNIFCDSHISCFFGFHNFKDFKYNYPIVLCEGTKDQIVLSRLYPYSLACLTSGLNGFDDITIIRHLTDKVIICYDNDNPGKKSAQRDKEKLIKSGCKVATAFYCSKDVGDLWNNPVGQNILWESLHSILSNF